MKKHRKQSNLKRVKGRVFERRWIELVSKPGPVCVAPAPAPKHKRKRKAAKRKAAKRKSR